MKKKNPIQSAGHIFMYFLPGSISKINLKNPSTQQPQVKKY